MTNNRNRSQGRKKSLFPSKSVVPDGSTFDFVDDGTNWKISFEDLTDSLGVTGTIVQAGDPTGIAVLDIQGSVNNVRNLEPGVGISASLSPENGIALGLNVASDNSGASVIEDVSADTLQFRSILAGNGIGVGIVGQSIQISQIDTPVTTKTVVVSQLSDFPDDIGGVITLANDTEYLLINDVTTTARFELGSKNSIRSGSQTLTTLTYSGTGAMFTGDNVQFKSFGMVYSCVNGSLYDITGSDSIIQLVESSCSVDDIGTIENVNFVRFSSVSWIQLISGGLLLSGTINTVFIESQIVLNLNGSFIDFGSVVLDNFIGDRIFVQDSQPSSVLLDGAVDSANIASGGLGSLSLCRFAGSGNTLNGISVDDVRWAFAANSGIPDTNPSGMCSVSGNSTETVISSSNTPVKMAATFTENLASWFETTSDGRITYIGESPISVSIDFSTSVEAAAGGLISITIYPALNGSVITTAGKSGTVSGNVSASITGLWRQVLQPNDYVEIWGENNDDTVNLVLVQAVLRVA